LVAAIAAWRPTSEKTKMTATLGLPILSLGDSAVHYKNRKSCRRHTLRQCLHGLNHRHHWIFCAFPVFPERFVNMETRGEQASGNAETIEQSRTAEPTAAPHRCPAKLAVLHRCPGLGPAPPMLGHLWCGVAGASWSTMTSASASAKRWRRT
jgi:hypothetical protein